MTVHLYPGYDALYSATNYKGLVDHFGAVNIRHTVRGFPAFDERAFAFILQPQNVRIYIDHHDDAVLREIGLNWCHFYGKINVDPALVPPDEASKVVALGPEFPLRLWNPPAALWNALRNYVLCRGHIRVPREHFANWWRQYRYRLKEEAYLPGVSEPNYIFFSASLWKNEPQCNLYRANFVEAGRSIPGMEFEGGFMPRHKNDLPGFEKYTVTEWPKHPGYLERTKRSAVVFNTPTVKGCFGWKIAEFMSMGKAILSTPLSLTAPAPLVHGENIHWVDGSVESLRTAISEITRNHEYRARLEKGARKYYQEELQPRCAIQRMLNAAEAAGAGFDSNRQNLAGPGTVTASFKA